MSERKFPIKKFIAAALSAVMVFGCLPQYSGNVSADTISELEQRLKDNAQKLENTKYLLSVTENEKDKEQEYQATLSEQIDILTDNISLLNEKIGGLETQVATLEESIAGKETEVEENFELFKKRFRAMYISGSGSGYASLLVGATDFFDLLSKMEMIKRIAEHDNALINELNEQITSLNADKALHEEQLAELSESKAQLETDMSDLNDSYSKSQQVIDMLSSEAAAYSSDIDRFEKEEAEIEAQLKQAILEKQRNEVQYVGGEFTWPLPGYTYISSPYGWRDLNGAQNFHKGTDITGSGVHGAQIVAANDGEVIIAKNTYTPGYSYGKYVTIDHGGGITTLYGHCSEVLVTVGQQVKKGDVIALVGNTGNSFGAHLHFEVRINGNHTDAMAYFTKTGG